MNYTSISNENGRIGQGENYLFWIWDVRFRILSEPGFLGCAGLLDFV
jgi:hypothetical protein